ncbi:hypothetical protein [Bacillus aerolatus]|uniref:hypothetical protein n=1 Tax=Bacillus aerolatus TaxID=2653354 RepID=UPI00177F5A39|nr:hypothetical protein [Bacillus aerolatus]
MEAVDQFVNDLSAASVSAWRLYGLVRADQGTCAFVPFNGSKGSIVVFNYRNEEKNC